MTLLLPDAALPARRAAVAGPLAPLAESLLAELAPLFDREPYIPREKALLSREGGRCPADGALLDFDPFHPHEHRCPLCGRTYTGAFHDRFWIYWYQLWLAERAVHGALLGTLAGDDRCTRAARVILREYAARYHEYPNRDNVLGPTRLFFSTYLESIWLLQLCIAADLLAAQGDTATRDLVIDRIIEPSRAIVASYDEGASNRQVWNNAALLASSLLLGRAADAESVVHGASGVVFHMREGLLPDGTWYEGENYHLFAHRGLWYAVAMAEVAGIPLPPALVARFQEGFATPFVAALPDFTLPSRRDSQYAISLRQPRFAELCELGVARVVDERLVGALDRLYGDDVPRADTGRARTSADVERNGPPSRLSRADLGWRSLLRALPVLPPLRAVAPASALLEGQGLGILRREGGRAYVALDYGHSGGGHGHPDRLDLLLYRDRARWLDDMGTGSYVDPSLHWYRSTLAHDAPLANGHSQERVHGRLLAWDDGGDAGWISAAALEIAPGVRVERTVIVMAGYVVDELVWRAEDDATIDLPLHLDANVAGVAERLAPAPLVGGDRLEDGFDFLRDCACAPLDAGACVRLDARSGDERLAGWCASDQRTEWWRTLAPGPPGGGERPFWVLRAVAREGRHRFVLAWDGGVDDVRFEGDTVVVHRRGGGRDVHARQPRGWTVQCFDGARVRRVDLGGCVAAGREPRAEAAGDADVPAPAGVLRIGERRRVSLGESDYRRSEESWREAGRPAADVTITVDDHVLHVAVDVRVGPRPLTFVAADAVNEYDNEHPDINGDGVQLYGAAADREGAWVLVPDEESETVRARAIDGWRRDLDVAATWRRTEDGYRIEARVALPDADSAGRDLALGVVVNEMPRDRERRRGQLVLGGARGEFVYLRGDRHARERLLHFLIADA